MDIHWHIGDVISKLRRAKHWNQAKLAGAVGVNKATIVRAEDGDPKVARATYLRIAEKLGTTIAALEVEAAGLQEARNRGLGGLIEETQRATHSATAGRAFRARLSSAEEDPETDTHR